MMNTQIVNSATVKISAMKLKRIKNAQLSNICNIYKSTLRIARNIKICLVTHWKLESQGRNVVRRVDSIRKSIL